MKRPAGLIASEVVLTLLSLLHVVFALGVAAAIMLTNHFPGAGAGAHATAPVFPFWIMVVLSALDLFILGLSIWGILTAAGLHRLRRWAQISVLIIGGGLATIGFFSMIDALMLIFIPLPVPPHMSTRQAQMMQTGLKTGFVFGILIYGAMLAIGVWWLVYFNGQKVRTLFTTVNDNPARSRRPLLIAVAAVLLVLGTLLCVLVVFVPLPCPVFALNLRGWGKALFLLVCAILSATAASGLWRLKEWGRRLTLALVAIGAVNCLIYILSPSILLSGVAGNVIMSKDLWFAPFWNHFRVVMQIEMVNPTLLLIAILFMLHHYRDRFRDPAPPEPEVLNSQTGG